MNYGEKFCELAYDALRREEAELCELNTANPEARPLSISSVGEATTAYLVTKQALRDKSCPRVCGEQPYADRGGRVDWCFADKSNHPVASFELKFFGLEEKDWKQRVMDDVHKHLDPSRRIAKACDECERYNALFVFAPNDDEPCKKPIEQVNSLVAAHLDDIRLYTSTAIPLNRVDDQRADRWRYLFIIVFTGTYKRARASGV